jgi:hypothetical protein
MSESQNTKHRRDAGILGLALLCSVVLAVVVGAGAFFWQELEQSKTDNAALAKQVRSLGGQPVAEGKPGESGKTGPPGPPGQQGIPGRDGRAGKDGTTPPCLLSANRCVGAAGANGLDGKVGPTGPTGPTGSAGVDGKDGLPGEDGAPGKDGAQGAAGVDGKDGAPGQPGADGKDGRGLTSIVCQPDGTWLITYTDNTTSTTDGPCRVVTPSLKATN